MSKFDKIFEVRSGGAKEDKQPEPKQQQTLQPAVSVKTKAGKAINTVSPQGKAFSPQTHSQPATATLTPAEASENSSAKQRGRPKAKRSDPNYVGFTTYIRKDTHLNVKIALLQEGKGRELSELVEELLFSWSKNR